MKEVFLKVNDSISNGIIELAYADDSIKSAINLSYTALENMAKMLEIMDKNNDEMKLLLENIKNIQ